MRVIDRIVSAVGRRVDDSSPMVDARLPDGSRVNAIIPPLAVDGPLLSIRRFPAERLKADDLVRLKALTQPMLDFLTHCVRARLNALISGGTGAGKTTLLNVLSSFISERERIVTIEDAAELQLHQEHVARLETRPPNVEGKGAIRQRQLLINSLRMRPDRIVVGEVRGEEALDMLQAMNTGHDGSLTTVHANTPRDALSRIETMIAMGATNLPERAMRQQISSAIQVVVQQTRLSDGTRKVTSISEITGMEGDIITMQEIFVFEKIGVTQEGKVIGRFRADRRPAEVRRAPQGVGHPPAGRHVRRRDGGAVMGARARRLRVRRRCSSWARTRPIIVPARASWRAARWIAGSRTCRASDRPSEDALEEGTVVRVEKSGPLPILDRIVAHVESRRQAETPDRAVGRPDDAERDRDVVDHRRDGRLPAGATLFTSQPFARPLAALARPGGADRVPASQASKPVEAIRRAVSRGARPPVARDPRRPRVPDRDGHGGRRTAGAGRSRVQEDVRSAELRSAAAGRAERTGGPHRPARRALLRDRRPDPARHRRQPVGDSRQPRARRPRALQDSASGARPHGARPLHRLRAARAAGRCSRAR